MTARQSIHLQDAARARLGVRLALQIAGLSFLVALVTTFWVNWRPGFPLAIGSFFLVVALFQYLQMRASHNKAASPTSSEPGDGSHTVTNAPPPGQFAAYVFDDDANPCFGTTAKIHGHTIYFDLLKDAHVETRIETIKTMLASLDKLIDSFERFKQSEAARQPDSAASIRALRIEMIMLYDRKEPRVAEVNFAGTDEGDDWSCILRGSDFSQLSRL